MHVTKTDKIIVELTHTEAVALKMQLNTVFLISRRLRDGLLEVLAPPPKCEVTLYSGGPCLEPAIYTWKITCIEDQARTKNYCTRHGLTRMAVESLNCLPCEPAGKFHKIVGIGKVNS